MATVEDVRKALESVKYPGYSRSIISFNIVKDIRITETGTEVELQLTTDKEEVVTALRNGVERVVGVELTASAGYGTACDENHLVPLLSQPCNLIDDGRHARHVKLAVSAGQHVRAYFYNYPFHRIFIIDN